MPSPTCFRRLVTGSTIAAAVVLTAAAPAFAHDEAPARGAPLSDIVPFTIVAFLAMIVLAAVSVGHRRGAFGLLARLGDVSERVSGLPGWAGVPIVVATVSLLAAVFGFYWDVSWHIDRGRDPGPLANPAHWFIIIGLAGIALAGVLAIVMGDERETGASIRFGKGWRVPAGGVLLAVCGVIALAGFPLDDAWHRIFGQDVTLWGPTHVQMIGGASLATLAMWVLLVEATRVRKQVADGGHKFATWFVRHQDIAIGGAFLLGLSTLQGEFDFGVPQFRQLYQPVLIMLAAGIGLVAVRLRGGRGAAIGATLFFLAVRGILTVLIAPILGRSTLHFPLYLVEALLVEVVVARVGPGRQLRAGLLSGVAIGTVGLAAEWAWSHLWMPLPWHAGLLPEAAIFGFVAAVTGGLLGGFAGRALSDEGVPRERTPRGLAVAAWIGALLVVAWPMPMNAPRDIKADVTLRPAAAEATNAGKSAIVELRMQPPDALDNANWFNVTAWQGAGNGDGGLVIADLHEVSPGTYRTDEAVPVSGTWKTLIRYQGDRALLSLPVYLPADDAIPANEVPADPTFTRTFVRDKSVLQREAVGGSPGMERLAYAGLALIGMAWIASLVWGLRRLERGGRDDGGGSDRAVAGRARRTVTRASDPLAAPGAT